MSFAVSLALIAAGAILRFATSVTNRGFNLHVTGDILMVVGLVGFVLTLIYWVSQKPTRPPTDV